MNKLSIQTFTWTLSLIVVSLAVFVWGQSLHWKIIGISNYNLFPVFGLVAFSLMWTHYMTIVLKIVFKVKMSVFKSYFLITGYVVFMALLLHPGLLIWQLWRDGLGLPPGSYENRYVAPGLGWVTILGTVSLFTFLTYELRRL